MSVSNFNTPSPIAVALDLYVADVRFAVSDRTDTIVEVRPSNPNKAADIKAAENTRVEYDDATRTLSIVSRKPRNRFVNFSGKRPESIDVFIQLPTDSDVRGEGQRRLAGAEHRCRACLQRARLLRRPRGRRAGRQG